jgi:hypothetical protein
MKNNPVQNIVREVVTSYVTTSKVMLVGSILGIGVIGANPAQAATFTYSGTTVGAPTWNRPNINIGNNPPTTISGSITRYEAFQFGVDVSGIYTFSSVNSWDDVNFLYQDSFNPSTPLANVILGQDPYDVATNNLSVNIPFTQALTVGTSYFLVKTGIGGGQQGTYSNTISGAGNITAVASTSVPEPFTIIGTLVGGTAAMRMRKKLKFVNKG